MRSLLFIPYVAYYLLIFSMNMLAAGLLIICLLPSVFSLPTSGSTRFIVRDQLSAVPAGFRPSGKVVSPNNVLKLTVALPQGNVSGLHAALLDVSDPNSPNYGHHLSKVEVRDQLRQLVGRVF